MSDLLIKGMEMPKVGGKIITIYADGRVLYDGGYIKAVHVPPHGRLIDEKDICDKIRPLIENPYCYNRLQVISETLGNCLQIVSDAPTIIPASEEKN